MKSFSGLQVEDTVQRAAIILMMTRASQEGIHDDGKSVAVIITKHAAALFVTVVLWL
jgi:hypothetical protein